MLHKAYLASVTEFCVIAFVRIFIEGLTLTLFSFEKVCSHVFLFALLLESCWFAFSQVQWLPVLELLACWQSLFKKPEQTVVSCESSLGLQRQWLFLSPKLFLFFLVTPSSSIHFSLASHPHWSLRDKANPGLAPSHLPPSCLALCSNHHSWSHYNHLFWHTC